MQVFSEGEGKGCTFIFKIPMRRRSSPLSLSARLSARSSSPAVNQIGSTSSHMINSNRRSSSAVVEVRQNGVTSQASPQTVRRKEAQRLGEQRKRLARSFLLVNGDDISYHDTQSAKKRAMHLANINRSYKSNVSSFREVNRGIDRSSDRLLPNDVESVPFHEIVDSVDVDGQIVGGGSAVSTQDKRRDSGRDGDGGGSGGSDGDGAGGGDRAVTADALKDMDLIDQTSLGRRGSNLSSPSRRVLHPGNMPSNKTMSTTLGGGEETRAPSNTTDKVADKVAPASSSPRKVSRQANVSYTGRSA